VLVFQTHRGSTPGVSAHSMAYDILASPIDVVDTWGPALLITDASDTSPIRTRGIEIGGGFLSLSEHAKDVLHWQSLPSEPGAAARLAPREAFSLRTKQRIGAIQLNNSCPLQASSWHKTVFEACEEDLHELGASPPRWVLQTVVTGAQAGQYALFNVGVEFEMIEGITLKDRIFHRLASTVPHILDEDLEAFYGLELSLCTRIARRVRLRSLLARVLPAYVHAHLPRPPGWEIFGEALVKALKTADFKLWLLALSKDHQTTVVLILGNLLTHLKDTGVTAEDTLNVAWIHPGQVQKCFRMKCNNLSGWARILTDTEYCATFACATTSCFEAGGIVCQNTCNIHWRNVTELLDTEICRHRVKSSGETTSTPAPFSLEDRRKYWMGTDVTATANLSPSPILETSRRNLQSQVEKVLQRARMIRRDSIRERGPSSGRAIAVMIKTQAV
jgi:hypothetical protein